MGRAIVRDPQAFLMDEPLSNLDAKLRVEMRAEIARIQRDLGVTTIYVTHDQIEAMTMGDRVAVMRNGLLQQVAVPKELYDRPRNLFVAEFIGSPAMNLVMARARRAPETGDVMGVVRRAATAPRAGDARAAPGSRPTRARRRRRHPARGHGGRRRPARDASRPALSVVCDIREDMGSEVYVHFNVEADPVDDARGRRGARGRGRRGRGGAASPPSVRAAGASPSSRASSGPPTAREREPLELEVDVTRLHFFDPETGTAVAASPESG